MCLAGGGGAPPKGQDRRGREQTRWLHVHERHRPVQAQPRQARGWWGACFSGGQPSLCFNPPPRSSSHQAKRSDAEAKLKRALKQNKGYELKVSQLQNEISRLQGKHDEVLAQVGGGKEARIRESTRGNAPYPRRRLPKSTRRALRAWRRSTPRRWTS